MAISHSPKSLFPFPLLLLLFSLLHFPPLSLSTDYSPPDRYFINCGSDSNTVVNGRNFLADVNPTSFSVTGDHTTPVSVSDTPNQLPTMSPLYHTARIFHKQSSYDLNISDNGTYMVRFHFYPFTSPGNNLFNSDFTLSASGFTLFSNFTLTQNNTTNLPIIKEFLLMINAGTFKIYFKPSKDSSFAFVNAIEAFLLPQDFIPNFTLDHVTISGRNGDYSILQSHVLQPIHRINVGGSVITQDSDTLWRNWVTDDDYIYSNESAITSQLYTGRLNYQDGGATKFNAPDLVYATARQLNIDLSSQVFNVNMSWNVIVSKNSTSLVRVHFCDILSGRSGAGGLTTGQFSLYIFRQFGYSIQPGPRTLQLAAPFYIDFVVDSDSEGYVNISIGHQREQNFTPFLNGLEIMELVNLTSGLVFISEGGKKKKITVIIGSVVGGVGLLVILVGVLFFGLKYRKAKAIANSDCYVVPQYGGDSYSMMTTDISGNHASPLPGLNLGLKIPFTEILQATKNFNPKLMIGEGGFGKVYEGVLSNGMKVAVKRSQPGQEQGFSEFQTEIMVLSKIRHRHLVSLIGYCNERSEMILIYEFMEKGTLREHLYGSNGERANLGSDLPWNQRLEICIGAAKGLHYLTQGRGELFTVMSSQPTFCLTSNM